MWASQFRSPFSTQQCCSGNRTLLETALPWSNLSTFLLRLVSCATLFGIFIDGLHHHLQSTCPDAGVKVPSLRLTDLVYADDICLMATSAAQLQALVNALATFCQILHMQISVAKPETIVVPLGPCLRSPLHAMGSLSKRCSLQVLEASVPCSNSMH